MRTLPGCPSRRLLTAAVAAVGTIGVSASRGENVALVAAPPYDATGNGFKIIVAPPPSGSNRAGVGDSEKFVGGASRGFRSFRLGADGSVAELGTLGTAFNDDSGTSAHAVNATGTAVGEAEALSGSVTSIHAVRWDAGTTAATQLQSLWSAPNGQTLGGAFDINAGATAVGWTRAYDSSGSLLGTRAIRWNAGGTAATELGRIGLALGVTDDVASAINTAGTIVGRATKFDEATGASVGVRAVRWAAGGTAATELGTLAGSGATAAFATGINSAGTAIGAFGQYDATGTSFQSRRAVRWDATGTAATELLGLAAPAGANPTTGAEDINNVGTVVGYADRYDGTTNLGPRAVRWDAGGNTATELRGLGADTSFLNRSSAKAINGSGIIVGSAFEFVSSTSALERAVLWRSDGLPIKLHSLLPAGTGWTGLRRATAISDTGWITGIGTYDNDNFTSGAPAYDRLFMMLVPSAGTYGRGDADFDGAIGFADLVVVAKRYNMTNASLATNVADFNLDGVVNFADLVALAQNYNTGSASVAGLGSATFTSDWALAQSLVPEPASLGLLTMMMALRVRQRR